MAVHSPLSTEEEARGSKRSMCWANAHSIALKLISAGAPVSIAHSFRTSSLAVSFPVLFGEPSDLLYIEQAVVLRRQVDRHLDRRDGNSVEKRLAHRHDAFLVLRLHVLRQEPVWPHVIKKFVEVHDPPEVGLNAGHPTSPQKTESGHRRSIDGNVTEVEATLRRRLIAQLELTSRLPHLERALKDLWIARLAETIEPGRYWREIAHGGSGYSSASLGPGL